MRPIPVRTCVCLMLVSVGCLPSASVASVAVASRLPWGQVCCGSCVVVGACGHASDIELNANALSWGAVTGIGTLGHCCLVVVGGENSSPTVEHGMTRQQISFFTVFFGGVDVFNTSLGAGLVIDEHIGLVARNHGGL
jgi:hypothetical protein